MFETCFAGLAGRVSLVTGGSRGIGAGIAAALAVQGAKVMVCGREPTALARVVEDIRSNGGEAETAIADLTDEDAARALRLTTEARFGAVELVVACAGSDGAPRPLLEEDAESWHRTLDANLTSAFLTLKTFLPSMCERGRGAIVTMASTAGRQVSGASAPYAAAKAGLLSLTRQAALEVAGRGVRVNAVAPSCHRHGSTRGATPRASPSHCTRLSLKAPRDSRRRGRGDALLAFGCRLLDYRGDGRRRRRAGNDVALSRPHPRDERIRAHAERFSLPGELHCGLQDVL